METRTDYWKALSKTRKVLLVTGLLLVLPALTILILVAGCREAWQFVVETT